MTRLQRWTLDNGLKVLFQQDASFPLASATLLLRTGSYLESAHEAGLSSMALDLLMQGTQKRDARGIARVMESVGASMGTQAHEDYGEIGFIVPAAEVGRALGIMTEILHEPSFPQEEIVKEKSHVISSLDTRKDAIFQLAYDHMSRALYGDHPYGRPMEGKISTVSRFQRKDMKAWHATQHHASGAVLSLIGPQSPAVMKAMLTKTMGRWRPSAKSHAKTTRDVQVLKKSHREEVKSHFEQAYLMTGWQAPTSFDKDQIVLKVLNTLLGGGMSSRLFVTLREELGLAYEVSSFYPSRFDVSQWVIYLGLPQERLKLAQKSLDALLETLADRGPRDDEMRQAKAMIRGSFLMDRQSRRRQCWYNAWWEFLGRGERYGEEFLQTIDAVSAKSVRDLLRATLAKPRITVTVVPR